VATVPIGQGVDGAAYDPATGDAFASNADGTLTVIHQDTPDKYHVVENVQTAQGGRNMGLDPTKHQVFVVSAKFGPPPPESAPGQRRRPSIVPGSFMMMVIERAGGVRGGAGTQLTGSARPKVELRLAEEQPGGGLTEFVEGGPGQKKFYLHGETVITTDDIIKAQLSTAYGADQPELAIEFTPEASKRMAEVTGQHIGDYMALLIDGRLVSAAKIVSRVSDKCVIAGSFTRDEVDRMAKEINGER